MVPIIPNAEQERANSNNAAGPEFRIAYHGTVSTLDLLTDAARQWAVDNLEIEPWQWLGKYRLAIEPRSMESIGTALVEAGFAEARVSRPTPKRRSVQSNAKVTIAVAALLVSSFSVSSCTVIRASELRGQMDAEMSACRAGEQDACERYQLLLQQYQVERANEGNVGILGIPRPGALAMPSREPFTCTTQRTLPGQSMMTCN
jgi:hypothetical protein